MLSLSPFFLSPCGKKFRSKPQIAKFLGENHNLDLSCFDFSRGAYGEATQRRRARDRQIKRVEPIKPMPIVKPLTINPLRPSGPIRRTCGVIKLPVTCVAPPTDDHGRTSLTMGDPNSQSTIHLIVQSLWEKRLFGVKPYDYITGDEIVEIKPITPITKPRTSSPVNSLHSPTTGGNSLPSKSSCLVPSVIQPASNSTPILPNLLQVHHQTVAAAVAAASPTLQTKVPEHKMQEMAANVSVIQQTGQPVVISQHASNSSVNFVSSAHHQRYLSSSPSLQYSLAQFNGLSAKPVGGAPIVPVAPMVTDRELQIQEERVRLLRQQLLAAASQRPS